MNKLVGSSRTIENQNSSQQQIDAAVVSAASGLSNAASAVAALKGYDIPALGFVNGLLNAANYGEKQALLESALASGNKDAILIASLDYAAAVAGLLGSIPGPHMLEAKALALLLGSAVSLLKNGDSISELFNSNIMEFGDIFPGSDLAVPRNQRINDLFRSSQTTVSPLVFDLDGDGIEIAQLSGNSPVLFDHDANGVKTGSAWLKSDDALLVLVLDRPSSTV